MMSRVEFDQQARMSALNAQLETGKKIAQQQQQQQQQQEKLNLLLQYIQVRALNPDEKPHERIERLQKLIITDIFKRSNTQEKLRLVICDLCNCVDNSLELEKHNKQTIANLKKEAEQYKESLQEMELNYTTDILELDRLENNHKILETQYISLTSQLKYIKLSLFLIFNTIFIVLFIRLFIYDSLINMFANVFNTSTNTSINTSTIVNQYTLLNVLSIIKNTLSTFISILFRFISILLFPILTPSYISLSDIYDTYNLYSNNIYNTIFTNIYNSITTNTNIQFNISIFTYIISGVIVNILFIVIPVIPFIPFITHYLKSETTTNKLMKECGVALYKLFHNGNNNNNNNDKETTTTISFTERLTRFYNRYNPEKIKSDSTFIARKVQEYSYPTGEEKLFKTLTDKYGPEPE